MNGPSTDKLNIIILRWPKKSTTKIEASESLIPSVPLPPAYLIYLTT